MGCFLILTGFSVFVSEFEHRANLEVFHLLFTPFLSIYLSTTILFYYSLALTNRYLLEAKKYRWLFIPVVFEILFQYLILLLGDKENIVLETLNQFIYLLAFPYCLFIFWLILKQLKRHNNNILTLFSTIEDKELNWLKHLVMVNIGFIIIWIIDDALFMIMDENIVSNFMSHISLFATLITIIWIGFSGTKQPLIFEAATKTDSQEDILKIDSQKKESPTNSEDELIFERIKTKIEQEKIFTNTNLSLKDLARAVELRDRELSRIINQCYGNNFFHFINSYRVAYFKELLKDPKSKSFSIVGLSMQAGFKSKSTFYTAFKKIEGKTPKEYEIQSN
ncbi:MAG: helix-turn-helix transcriptional regulator [Aureispira sp.]|nr:helix-turn-helix transcriptional regulator [Aureispira sp.]